MDEDDELAETCAPCVSADTGPGRDGVRTAELELCGVAKAAVPALPLLAVLELLSALELRMASGSTCWRRPRLSRVVDAARRFIDTLMHSVGWRARAVSVRQAPWRRARTQS